MKAKTCYRAVAVLAFAAASCVHGEGLTLPKDASRVPEDQMVTLLKEAQSGVQTRRRWVIRSEEEWVALWNVVYAGRTPVPERPQAT